MVLGSTSRTRGRMPSSWRRRSSTWLLEALQLPHHVGEEGGRHLHLHLYLVERPLAVQHDLIVRLHLSMSESTAAMDEGYTFTPRMTNMSSVRA